MSSIVCVSPLPFSYLLLHLLTYSVSRSFDTCFSPTPVLMLLTDCLPPTYYIYHSDVPIFLPP